MSAAPGACREQHASAFIRESRHTASKSPYVWHMLNGYNDLDDIDKQNQRPDEGAVSAMTEQPQPQVRRQGVSGAPANAMQWLIERLIAPPVNGASVDTESEAASRSEQIAAQLEHPGSAEMLVDAVFPDGVPADRSFFDRLRELSRLLGFHAGLTGRILGKVWSASLSRVSEQMRESVLNAVTAEKGHDLFVLLGALEPVLAAHELRPAFAATFFTTLAELVARDCAQGVFFSAVHMYGRCHVASALQIIRELVSKPCQARLDVAAFLLGTLRKLPCDDACRQEFECISTYLADHPAVEYRAAFDCSWVPTAWQAGLTVNEIGSLVARADHGTAEERQQVIASVCRSLIAPSISADVFAIGLGWLRRAVDSSTSSMAKYQVADFARNLASSTNRIAGEATCGDGLGLLLAIQPISADEGRIWEAIEHYLVAILQFDLGRFCQVFFHLAQRNASGLLGAFRTPRSFEWLRNEMRPKAPTELVGHLVVSTNAECRKLGLYLFDELRIESLPFAVLEQAAAGGVRLGFHELQRSFLSGKATARLLVCFLSYGQSIGDAEFEGELLAELLLQCRNRAGDCRGELEQLAGNVPVVRQCLQELATYYQALKDARESGIAAMEVPGYRRASTVYRRRFAREVSHSAREHSVLMQLCRSVSLLYGRSSGMYANGTLTGPSALHEVSHGMELPVLEYSDPEGMTLRRWYAASRIAAIRSNTDTMTADTQ